MSASNAGTQATPSNLHPVVLVSIDGWGHTDKKEGNAIANAKTPTMNKLHETSLAALIDASGLAVGLPEGIMGNSEVGHLTMGAGRVAFQDLVRINSALKDGSFYTNPRLVAALDTAKNGTGRFHLLGLVSDGAVHSHIEHLEAFLSAAKKHGVPNTYVHFFADGRGQRANIHSCDMIASIEKSTVHITTASRQHHQSSNGSK